MKKAFAATLVAVGVGFIVGGAYAVHRGLDAKHLVRAELHAQNIRTPADAAIPNSPVRSAATAEAMADIVDHHARKATGGLSFGEMGRFVARDGAKGGTSIEADAVRGPDGQPVRNPLRTVAFEASAVRTGLYTSVMAFNVADLVVGVGLMTLVLGVSLAGVGLTFGQFALPALSRRRQLTAAAAVGA